jgi:hypothetical protein
MDYNTFWRGHGELLVHKHDYNNYEVVGVTGEDGLTAVQIKNQRGCRRFLYGCPDLMPGRMHGELPRISFRGWDENWKKSRGERELFMVLPSSTNDRDSLGGELFDEVITF